MSKTLLIAFNGTLDNGQFLGDQICSLKTAWMFAETTPHDRLLLAMSPSNQLHFLWQKFIDTFKAEVVYDTFHPGNMEQRFESWAKWHRERNIEGRKFDDYRELYRRIDGGRRQPELCGVENGMRRKNIFEYFYFGQENFKEARCENQPAPGGDVFDDSYVDHATYPPDYHVLIAPYAKCQGNHVFTFDFWADVVHRLIDTGVTVTVNFNGNFCDDLNGNPLFRKIYPDFKGLLEECCRHRLVACGNTGVGWLAASAGIPLLAMQPPNSNMADYRYEECGVKSLVEIVDAPDAGYVARRIVEEVNRTVVFTTGCYDVLHAGHVRHLEESRALGTKLIVALNSDASVRQSKGADRPVNNQDQRRTVLRAIRYVDDVRVFDGENALELIRELRPDVITNGCDHKLGEVVGKSFVEQYGGRVVITGGTRDQSSTKIIARAARQTDILKAIQDASGVSPNPYGKLRLLADQFLSVAHLEGDAADVGAYKGGCSLIMRRLAPEKVLHLFDTWSGNPIDDPLCHHKRGEWPASMKECQALVGVNEKTHYWEGTFPYSAKQIGFESEKINESNFSFVLVDPDTYQTTLDAIEFFWPRMVPGGKMLFDDYGWEPCAGVKKAVDEKFAEDERVVFPQSFTCVVVKK
jgi:rfaE bifunctional protein nucleotidyltransferase chain/domain